jgi:hypothetical protein
MSSREPTHSSYEAAAILGVAVDRIARLEADGVLLGHGPSSARRFTAYAVEVARKALVERKPAR